MKFQSCAVALLVALGAHSAAAVANIQEGHGSLSLPQACADRSKPTTACASAIAHAIVGQSKKCFEQHSTDRAGYTSCAQGFCRDQCGSAGPNGCQDLCVGYASPLFMKFTGMAQPAAPQPKAALLAQAREAADEQASAMQDLEAAQARMRRLNIRMAAQAAREVQHGDAKKGRAELAAAKQLSTLGKQIEEHLANVAQFRTLAQQGAAGSGAAADEEMPPAFLQQRSFKRRAGPEDELAKEMTHDLEMNFNKIAPFGKEDTAKELQDHAAKTQDTLVDAVENAEVAEIKRAVFRALTRLRAATIKEFDTIARLETQAIDAYNDAHHYRAENPLAHLHEDEAPVETDKLKSFH